MISKVRIKGDRGEVEVEYEHTRNSRYEKNLREFLEEAIKIYKSLESDR